MKDFLFVYRSEPNNEQRSPEEMQASMNRWMSWLGSNGAQGKLVDRGNSLNRVGRQPLIIGTTIYGYRQTL